MKILTGIVTFNPHLKRLNENIDAIINQDTDILIFDNGSDNRDEIKALAELKKCKIICSKKNNGIAYGLSIIMSYAKKYHYDWVLTLDQDSVASLNLITEYKKYINDPKIGALTCIIRDRNFIEIADKSFFKAKENKLKNVPKCVYLRIIRLQVMMLTCLLILLILTYVTL